MDLTQLYIHVSSVELKSDNTFMIAVWLFVCVLYICVCVCLSVCVSVLVSVYLSVFVCYCYLMWLVIEGEGDHFAVFITDNAPRVAHIGHRQGGVLYHSHQCRRPCSRQNTQYRIQNTESTEYRIQTLYCLWFNICIESSLLTTEYRIQNRQNTENRIFIVYDLTYV